MQDLTAPVPMAPHPGNNVHPVSNTTAAQIGPREAGVVYYDGPHLVQVRAVITDLAEARRVLRRRSAQYAIEIVDLHTGTAHYTGAVWTGSDRVLKAVAA